MVMNVLTAVIQDMMLCTWAGIYKCRYMDFKSCKQVVGIRDETSVEN
jgi:hypothetical protein